MKQKEAVHEAASTISRRDAETLLLHVAARDRAWLLAYPEAELSPKQINAYFDLVQRRAGHAPLQYLTERQEFYGLDLRITPDVLIPRPETELLVEAVLAWVRQLASTSPPRPRLADVGTGSGAIALALASELPEAEIWALDLSPAALAIARENAGRLGMGQRVFFREADLLAGVVEHGIRDGSLDVVVSNPPYVPWGDAREMQPEVRDFEPHLALFAGEDGLEIYRRLIPQAWTRLRPGGLLAMEFGFGQKPGLASLLEDWTAVRFLDDYAGIPRVTLAERR